MRLEIYDRVFGRLRQDQDHPWRYGATVDFLPGENVSICFAYEGLADTLEDVTDDEVARALEHARGVYAAFQEREPQLRRSVAARYLNHYITDWLEDDPACYWDAADEAAPETRELREDLDGFMEPMKLHRITFSTHQILSVAYSFGDLFGGVVQEDDLQPDLTL